MHFNKTETGLWVDLLKECQLRADIPLSELEESYLVFMLQRFMLNTELMGTTLALNYLESLSEKPSRRQEMLSDTADAGLILAGLFPEYAKKLHVSSSYFVDMSRLCFLDLASVCHTLKHGGEAELYRVIARGTRKLAIVLSKARKEAAEALNFGGPLETIIH